MNVLLPQGRCTSTRHNRNGPTHAFAWVGPFSTTPDNSTGQHWFRSWPTRLMPDRIDDHIAIELDIADSAVIYCVTLVMWVSTE